MRQETIDSIAAKAGDLYQSGKYQEAAALFEQAAQIAATSGDSTRAAEMANNRSVALLQSGDAQAAYEAALGTDEIFLRAGDNRRRAMAFGNQAAALEALNQHVDALKLYQKSSDLLKQVGDRDTRAYVLKRISALQIRSGRQLEALVTMDAALENQGKLKLQDRFLKKLLDIPVQWMKRGS